MEQKEKEKEKRYYNVVRDDGKERVPVHIMWTYPLAVKLRKELAKEHPQVNFWIEPYVPKEGEQEPGQIRNRTINAKRRAKVAARKQGFVTICSDCGFPLTKDQVGINDTLLTHDYTEHCEALMGFVLCLGCLARWKDNAKGGMAKAIERYEELQEYDRDDKGTDEV